MVLMIFSFIFFNFKFFSSFSKEKIHLTWSQFFITQSDPSKYSW